MKSLIAGWSVISLLFDSTILACSSDADCSGGQICCKCEGTKEAWGCGGDCIIPNGGYCCVNPNCIEGCPNTD